MKARLNGTKDPFVEITEVSLADKPYVVYDANRIEFEQEQEPEPTSDHWQDLRERAAIAAMQGLLSDGRQVNVSHVIKYSIICADELIKKLKGE